MIRQGTFRFLAVCIPVLCLAQEEIDPGDLSRLHDFIEPPPVPLWPLAPGWIVLGACMLAILLTRLIQAGRRYRANAYRREALQALTETETNAAANCILKRTALAAYPRAETASLSAADWMAWLNAHCLEPPFPEDLLPCIESIYQSPETDLPRSDRFRVAAMQWIEQHTPLEEDL